MRDGCLKHPVENRLGRVVGQEELVRRVAEAKRAGKRVVFTNGCYDLLHPGHIRLLEASRELGDILVLALNSDRSVRQNKGANRPIIPEDERAEIAAAFNFFCAGLLRHGFGFLNYFRRKFVRNVMLAQNNFDIHTHFAGLADNFDHAS